MADLAGKAELVLGVFHFCLRKSRSAERFYFENADARLCFDLRASGGWVLEVVLRAVFLATHTLAQSLALADSLADQVGLVLGTRLRRFDLCADFVGYHLLPTDIHRIVAKSRRDLFIADSKDDDEASGYVGFHFRKHVDRSGLVTGFTVSAGNPLSARIYRKDQELAIPGREEKRAIEQQIWKASGYSDGQAVVRVEFQVRGAAIDDFSARDPNALESLVDGVWQYSTHEWLRFVDPRTASRLCRAKSDSRWQVVQSVVFHHVSQPATRARVRGGAKPEHVLGAITSRLGAAGKMCPEIIPKGDLGDLPPSKATSLFDKQLELLFDNARADVREHLFLRYGPSDALVVLREKMGASRARFWSIDDATAALNDELCSDMEDDK